MTAAIICSDLNFAWPDGAPVLSGLTVSFGPGRTGLIGVNGSGKSTLLRLIAAELRPNQGTVRTEGEVGYLPQAITLGTHRTVSDLLGITAARYALHAIEAGETGEEAFAAVGDDWDVEEWARAWLDRLGLTGLDPDDRVERLSATTPRSASTSPVPPSPPPALTLAELIVRGPERIALTGPNGVGKTTLLRAIAGLAPRPGLGVRLGAVVGYLPQRLDLLDDSLSVVDNVRAAAPAASVNEVRASLARFLFRGERAGRLAGALSGGERFRAVLAALLLAQPAPQLLLLDEPTNNLDLASVRQLSQALEGYRGAILIASHDLPFLRSAGITRWLRLDREAGLTAVEPP